MTAPATARPPAAAATPARVTTVDALRGFALLGILVVNITYFASQYRGTGVLDPDFARVQDRWVYLGVDTFFETKFYLLFSFLFGYSFTLQLTAAARRGAAFAPRFLRRLLGLFTIGALHALLLFHGDILMLYAVLGLILLPLSRLRARTAALLGAGLLVAATQLWLLWGVRVWDSGEPDGVDAGETSEWVEEVNLAYQGGLGEILSQRWDDLQGMVSILLDFQGPAALAMFLFGLAAGKHRALADPLRHKRALWTLIALGVVVGLPGGAFYAYAASYHADTALQFFAGAWDFVASPLLAGGYGAASILVFHASPALTRWFAPAGRMALSNYLGQSLFCAVLFTGYGLGLTGELSPPTVLLLGLVLFAAQAALSASWLRLHEYGPAEWVVRAVSYAELPRWHRRRYRGSHAAG